MLGIIYYLPVLRPTETTDPLGQKSAHKPYSCKRHTELVNKMHVSTNINIDVLHSNNCTVSQGKLSLIVNSQFRETQDQHVLPPG